MKNTLMKFGVVFSKRFTRGQKNRYLTEIAQELSSTTYSIEIQKTKSNFGDSINCLIGDFESARKIVVASYDTPSKVVRKNYLHYPFNVEKNIRNERINLLLQSVIALFFILPFIFWLFSYLTMTSGVRWLSSMVSIFMLFYAVLVIQGIPNKINMNQNSASVALLIETVKAVEGKEVAFALVDHGVSSFRGFSLLDEKIQKDAEVILLDCLGEGNQLVCAYKEQKMARIILDNKELNFYKREFKSTGKANTILDSMKNTTYIGSGYLEDKQFVVKNIRTKRDFHINVERLEKLKEILIEYLEG